MLIGYGFLKCEVSESLAVAGCVAAFAGISYLPIDWDVGDDEPDDGVEVEWDTVPDVIAEDACQTHR